MTALLEFVIMPKTNSRSDWKWRNYIVRLKKPPSEKEIRLTLVLGNESVSEEFEIKNMTEKNGVTCFKTAYTVVSDNFYDLAQKYCKETTKEIAESSS